MVRPDRADGDTRPGAGAVTEVIAGTACLLATSTVFLEDVYLTLQGTAPGSSGTGSVTQSRILTLVLGVLAAAVACIMHDVIAALTVGYDLLVGAIFVPILAAIITDRGSPMAALASIVTSTIVVVTLILVYGIDSVVPIYEGLAVSSATFLIGSRLRTGAAVRGPAC